MKKPVKITLAVVVSLCVVYSVLVMSGAFVKKEPETTEPVSISTVDLKYDKNVALRIVTDFDEDSKKCDVKVYAKKTTDDKNVELPAVTDDKKMGDYTLVSENFLSSILDTDKKGSVSSDVVYTTSDGNVYLIAVNSPNYVSAEFKGRKYNCDTIKIKDEQGKECSISIFKFTATEYEYNVDFKFCLIDKNNKKIYGF